MRGSSSRPFLRRRSLALSAAAPDLGRGVAPLGRSPSGMGYLLSAALRLRLVRRSQPPHLPEMTLPIPASDAYTGHPTNRPVFVFKKKVNIDITIIPVMTSQIQLKKHFLKTILKSSTANG